jgi:hypothetical protein
MQLSQFVDYGGCFFRMRFSQDIGQERHELRCHRNSTLLKNGQTGRNGEVDSFRVLSGMDLLSDLRLRQLQGFIGRSFFFQGFLFFRQQFLELRRDGIRDILAMCGGLLSLLFASGELFATTGGGGTHFTRILFGLYTPLRYEEANNNMSVNIDSCNAQNDMIQS